MTGVSRLVRRLTARAAGSALEVAATSPTWAAATAGTAYLLLRARQRFVPG